MPKITTTINAAGLQILSEFPMNALYPPEATFGGKHFLSLFPPIYQKPRYSTVHIIHVYVSCPATVL